MPRAARPAAVPVETPSLPKIADALVTWQHSHGRHGLPWQGTRDPYRVWLSEIMLQQTQVATVLRYYQRFLDRYPDVAALAAAPLDDVLTLWSGLGYYSRARNLHRCAVVVQTEWGGAFPRSAEALARLPGIGASTAAAIASFCFDERVSILDGNVKRVLSRVLAFGDDLADARHTRALHALAQRLLPEASGDMPAYTQGLMDLGASLCRVRDPQCLLCPIEQVCRARLAGEPTAYPLKTRKLQRGRREQWWLWIERAGPLPAVWLQQRPAPGVWAGLWSLPLFDSEAALNDAAKRLVGDGLGLDAIEVLPTVQHALTHFDWTLHPRRVVVSADVSPEMAGRWQALDQLADVALPAPLRKLITR